MDNSLRGRKGSGYPPLKEWESCSARADSHRPAPAAGPVGCRTSSKGESSPTRFPADPVTLTIAAVRP